MMSGILMVKKRRSRWMCKYPRPGHEENIWMGYIAWEV